MITCINVNKRSMRKQFLQDINLKFEPGYIYGLVGPNGSGKSTLMKLIAGLLRPSEGEITIQNQSIGCKTKAMIAFSPSEPYLYDWMTAKKCVQFYSDFYKDFSQLKCLQMLEKLQVDLNLKIDQLSSGQVSGLKVALTLSRNADIILMDEPFRGLDPVAKEICFSWILDMCHSDRLFILASHQVDNLEVLMDRIIVMKDGKVKVQANLDHMNLTPLYTLKSYYKEVIS